MVKLDKLGQGGGLSSRSIVLAAVLVVAIIGAGFFLYRTVAGGGAGGYSDTAAQTAAAPAGDTGAPPPPSSPAPYGPEGAAPAPQTTGAQPMPAPPASKPPAAAVGARQVQMRQVKVFGTVTASYPDTWKIKAGGGNTSAIFTDGKGYFEVHAPDPRANSARAIAESALKTLARGAAVIDQGTDRISGHEAYWIAAKLGGRVVRIVGVDAPTRVALYEHVEGGQFSSYRDVFDQMKAGMRF